MVALSLGAGMKPPTANELREKVIIRSMTETRGADGSVIETPATFATVWARIIPLSGNENFVAQGIDASVVYDIWTRYIAGVTPQMNILWGSRTLTIQSVRNYDERRRWLVIAATEFV